jgi:hypothetical protein
MHQRKRLKTHGPFTLSLPPVEQTLLAPWLKHAASQVGNPVPNLAGHVRLQVRIGLADVEGPTLGQIVPAIMALLASENIVKPSRVADVDASWDRAVAPEEMVLTIRETIAPAQRIGAATRQRVREAQQRRWAALRAPANGECRDADLPNDFGNGARR